LVCSCCGLIKAVECATLGEDKKSSQEEEGRVGLYYGETSHSLYKRSKEHLNDAVKFREGSHIIKHWIAEHPEEDKPPFQFSVLQSFKDCISRRIEDALNQGSNFKQQV
jgi:hypothetical protein